MELRALAAVKRAEKEADALQKQNSTKSVSSKVAPSKSSKNDVIVEEIGSDEEDVYEGKIDDIDENDPNELTDNTPETRNAVYFNFYYSNFEKFFIEIFFNRCILRLLNKRKKRLKEKEPMLQKKEIMKKSMMRQLKH